MPIFPLSPKKVLTLFLAGSALAAPLAQAQTTKQGPTAAVGHASPGAAKALERVSDPDFDRAVPPAGIMKVLTRKDPRELLKLSLLLAKHEKAVGHPHRKVSKEKVLRLALERAKATNDTATIGTINAIVKVAAARHPATTGQATPKLTSKSRAFKAGRLTSPTRDDDDAPATTPDEDPSNVPNDMPDITPDQHPDDNPGPFPDMPDLPGGGGDDPMPMPDLPDFPGGDLPPGLPDLPDFPGGDFPMPSPDGPGLPGGNQGPFDDPTGPLLGLPVSGSGGESGGTGVLDELGAAMGGAVTAAMDGATAPAHELTGASRDFDPAMIGAGRTSKHSESRLSAMLDPAFDTIVSPKVLGAAWKRRDASALTDAGLMLAEGERVLKRHRTGLPASELLLTAARIAGEQHDRNTLDRLAGYARESGNSALADRVKQARKAVGTTPSKSRPRLAATSRAIPANVPTMTANDVRDIIDGLDTVDVAIHSSPHDARRGHPADR